MQFGCSRPWLPHLFFTFACGPFSPASTHHPSLISPRLFDSPDNNPSASRTPSHTYPYAWTDNSLIHISRMWKTVLEIELSTRFLSKTTPPRTIRLRQDEKVKAKQLDESKAMGSSKMRPGTDFSGTFRHRGGEFLDWARSAWHSRMTPKD